MVFSDRAFSNRAFPDYGDHDALALAALIRKGEVTRREVVEAAIAMAERIDPALNAIVSRQFEAALAEAEAPAAPAAAPNGAAVDPDCVAAAEAAARLCADLGHVVEEAAVPVDDAALGRACRWAARRRACRSACISPRASGRKPRCCGWPGSSKPRRPEPLTSGSRESRCVRFRKMTSLAKPAVRA